MHKHTHIHTPDVDSTVPLPAEKSLFGNRAVWIGDDRVWHMLQEVGPAVWEIYLYESIDGKHWSLQVCVFAG